jgi:MFS transporter, ACS family, hexuronate transporter
VSFIVIALVGLCWAIVWMLFVTERPEQDADVSAGGRTAAAAGPEVLSTGPRASLGRLLIRPGVLATAFAFFGYA